MAKTVFQLFFTLVLLALALPALPDSETIGQTTWTFERKGTGVVVKGAEPVPYGILEVPARLGGRTVTEIGSHALYNKEGVTRIVIPSGVTNIQEYAFGFNNSMVSVSLPSTLKALGEWCFHSCSALMSVVIPNGVREIPDQCFYECRSLSSVSLPSSVVRIGDDAFRSCTSLTSLMFPASLKSIGGCAFMDAGLTSVELPYGLLSMGWCAFESCPDLMHVSLPDSLECISCRAFDSCSNLKEIVIPANVAVICSSAFSWYSGPTKVVFLGPPPVGLNRSYLLEEALDVYYPAAYAENYASIVSDECFAGYSESLYGGLLPASKPVPSDAASVIWRYERQGQGMRVLGVENEIVGHAVVPSVIDGRKVISIGASAFHGQQAMTHITLPETLTEVGDGAFAFCDSLVSVRVPNGVVQFGDGVFESCDALISVELPETLTQIPDRTFYDCHALTTVNVPRTTVRIGQEAFRGCYALAAVDLPDGLEYVGALSFESSGLTQVSLPDSVVYLGDSAFESCLYLKSVRLSRNLQSILVRTFDNAALETVIVPQKVLTLGAYSFECRNLATVVFLGACPANVKSSGILAHAKNVWYPEAYASEYAALVPESSFAGYSPTCFEVEFKADADAGRMENQEFTYGESQPLRKNRYSRRGREFLGWSRSPVGDVEYQDGAVVSNLTNQADGRVTLHARWQAIPYGIDYVDTKGSVNLNPVSYTVEETVGFVALTNVPGWRFVGWTPAEIVAGTVDRQVVTAKWQAIPAGHYGMELFVAGVSSPISADDWKLDKVYKLPPCTATPPSGTRFAGWQCSNGRRYDDGMLVFDLAKPGETVTMTAIWE